MSTTTTNYKFVKPALTDAPPDITAMNPNWDKIDELLGDAWYKTATVIDSNTNLNNFSEVGLYVYSSASAATITNIPEVSQGTLIVLPRLTNGDSSNITQVVLTRENSIFVRARYDNTWQEWSKVASTAQFNSITASSLSAVSWTQLTCDTFAAFWDGIYNASGGVTGSTTFRVKDTTGWCATKRTGEWYNGIAVWQNAPSSTDNVNGMILLRANTPTDNIIYKGMVTGNATNGYTVSWVNVYDTGNKPTISDIGSGTFGGAVKANTTAMATLTNTQLRNIYAGTSDLTAGSSSLTSGSIYLVYE